MTGRLTSDEQHSNNNNNNNNNDKDRSIAAEHASQSKLVGPDTSISSSSSGQRDNIRTGTTATAAVSGSQQHHHHHQIDTTTDASSNAELVIKEKDDEQLPVLASAEDQERRHQQDANNTTTTRAEDDEAASSGQPTDGGQARCEQQTTGEDIKQEAAAEQANQQQQEREAIADEPPSLLVDLSDIKHEQQDPALISDHQQQQQPQLISDTGSTANYEHAQEQQRQQHEQNLINQQLQQQHQQRTSSDGQPEYTILTPVTPLRPSSQMQQSSGEQMQQQQPPPPTTILTDLDAASAHQSHLTGANTTSDPLVATGPEGSGQSTYGGANEQATSSQIVKIEVNQQQQQQQQQQQSSNQIGPPSSGPLTELRPASAVGLSTLSELTSIQLLPSDQQEHTNSGISSLVGGTHLHQQQLSDHLLASSDQQQQELLPKPEPQQHAQLQRQQAIGELLSGQTPGLLTAIGTSNASNSSACSSQASNSASTGGAGRGATGTPASLTSGIAQVPSVGGAGSVTSGTSGPAGGGTGKRRTWNQVNRNLNKTEIMKVYSQYGFRCYLETPISTCRRKEEDRITYINKGEFYGLTLEYIPDPQKPLRSAIVKTVVMLVFREEKSPEEDLKSWQFWHGRQHSAKQRILDADNKNHLNVINQIEEVSLNAIAFYWNPIETRTAKLNVAVQCLSTDFSNQKGVKGLPLNLQVDIYDLFTETSTPVYRGYATLLSYCDKGAQRRSRDEERRAMKRKMADTSGGSQFAAGTNQAAGSSNKKFEDLYHKPCDRSEFYSMADLIKPPTLYSPTEEQLLDVSKQPMSQSSGVSITPISATTPIPSIESLQQYPSSQQQQVSVVVNQQHQQSGNPQQPTSGGANVINSPQQPVTGRPVAPTLAGPPPPPHSSYSIISTSDQYLQHPQQQQQQQQQPTILTNTTGIPSGAGAPHPPLPIVPPVPGSQQSGHGMIAMGQQGQQQQQSHLIQQQSQHQLMTPSQAQQQHQPQQQQHHHYHAMGASSLQAGYGIMQTDHHQPQQYAILQAPPSIAMVQSHHHPHQQQQMIAANQQQHQASNQMVDSRTQQQQHQSHQQHLQQSVMMGQSAMMGQQQSGQQQQQMHQYQQPIMGITTASIPIGGAQPPFAKRAKMYPDERVLIYAKQADEKDFYPLHLAPPSLSGLVYAIEQKYKIDSTKVANIYKKSKKGIRVQMDDEMIRHYCNEDMVQLEVIQTSDSRLEITLVEL